MQIYSVFLRRVSRNLRTLLAFTILVAATMLSTQLRAQTLRDYEFSTGVDASKWITTSDWTSIVPSGITYNLASTVNNIGFSFPFGDSTYTQFSVNSNGIFRLGSEATLSYEKAGMFDPEFYTRNNPKISGEVNKYGLGTGTDGYIRYAVTGTTPNRVLVCEYCMAPYQYSVSAQIIWQVQLHETTGEVTIVYGSTTPSYSISYLQTGLATSPTDIVLLSPDTHTPVYSNTHNNTVYNTWHGTNRYYSFMLPNSTCPRPESIAVSDIGTSSLTATWVDNGGATQWEVRLDSRNVQGTPVVVNTPTYTFTGLTNGTDYSVRVRGICGPGDTTAVRSRSAQTLCGYLQLPYSEGFEDALGTLNTANGYWPNNLPNCWDYNNEGYAWSMYPYVILGPGRSSMQCMQSHVDRISNSSSSPEYAFLPLTDSIRHPVNSLELRYYMRRLDYTGKCIVGITPDPTDISTFIPVDSAVSTNNIWIQRIVHFNNYTGPHGRVTMLFPKQLNPNWAWIDDIYLFSHNSFDTVTHTACNSYTWPENSTTYTNSGNYNHTLPNAAGYDSIITLQLTIYHSYAGDTTAVVCDSITWRGNYYSESGNYIDTIFLSPLVGCDSTSTLHLTVNHRSGLPAILPGATESHFSVSSTQTVQFSKGNLQYQASTGLWRFAEHQYDYVGSDNHNISSTYNGWIDLFGWGTSGWNSGATAYQPYSFSNNPYDYRPGNNAYTDLTGSYAEADWGWHNAIQNGGNRNHLWRTLIHTEWVYLFNTRTTNTNLGTPNARYAKASINGTKGVILFPDEYTHPANVAVPVGINATDNTGLDGNTYSTTDWDKMDSAGAVFLPAAGVRGSKNYFNSGPTGYYWAADRHIFDDRVAYNIKFNNTSLHLSDYNNKDYGYSVRPVHNTDPITTNDTVAEACDSFTWWNTNYTNSTNTPTHLYSTTAGCDSLVTLHLTINHSTTGDTTATACDSFTWWGTTYTSSTNTATHTFTNAAGCDSVVTLHLTIKNSTTGDTTVTTCNSFTWWNTNYTNSTNSATHTFTNAADCDSVVTLHLTINHSNTGDTNATACNSFTWWNTNYTNSTNSATHTFTNAAGCDSVVTLHLTINHSNTGDTTVTACDSFTWWGNNYTSSTNTTTHTFTNVAGCDSVVTLHLTINHPTAGDTTVTACDSFTWWGTNYTTTGNYVRTWPSALPGGCDSVVTLHLTVNYSNTGIEDTTVCNRFFWHGTEYTSSTNTPTFTCLNTAGCDSVTTLHLTVNHCSTTPITVCDSYTWRGHTYTTSGIYVDGTDTLNLTVNHSNTGDTTATACDNFSWWNTNYTNSTNSATYTFNNAAGCDSVVTLHLTINHSTTGDTMATACDNFSWWNTNYTNSTNSATHTFTNAAGCDSVVTLHLTINHATTGDTTAIACDSFTWWGTNYTTTGDFMRTWPSALPGGCDSVTTLHLTVNYSTTGDTTVTACDSFTWWGTNYTISTNTATQTFTNLAGCDFVVTLHLTIHHSNTGIEDTTVCNSFIWHGTEYTTSTNTPTFTCLNTAGCDSVTTLHLTINQCSSTAVTTCDSYTWRGTTYTATGIYTDGTDTLNLTVNHSNTGDTSVTTCNSFSWWNTNYTNSTNSATHTFTNAAGCDSVVTLHLTIHHSNTGDTTVTACNSFTWWNTNYTNTTNNATHVYTNVAGCDSVVTLHLTINHTTTGDTTATACDSFTWWGTNYTTTGDFMRTWPSALPGGCDSIATLHLTVNPMTVLTHTPDTVIMAGDTITLWATGATWLTWTDSNGAQLSNTGYLSVHPNVTTSYYVSSFSEGPNLVYNGDFELGNTGFTNDYIYGNTGSFGHYHVGYDIAEMWPWDSPGFAVHDHTSNSGLFLMIDGAIQPMTRVWSQTVEVTPHTDYLFSSWVLTDNAGYFKYEINGVQTGFDYVTPDTRWEWKRYSQVWNSDTCTHATLSIVNRFSQSAGYDYCIDDITFSPLTSCSVTDTVTVNIYTYTYYDSSICANMLPFVWHNNNLYSSGIYTDTINAGGNDIIVTLTLSVNPVYNDTINDTICNNGSSLFEGVSYTTAGLHTVPLHSTAGCDSIRSLNLTVNAAHSADTTAMVCDSIIWNGVWRTANGDYSYTTTTATGCDSTATLHLTINHSTIGDTTASACDSFTWWNTNYTNSTNTATHTFTNVAGCDSVVTLHLTINHATTGDTTATACNSFTWWGTNYTTTGDFMRTRPSLLPGGCDSVVTLHLTVNYSNTGIEDTTVCNSFVWHGTTYTSSTNTPTFTCLNAAGCDSVTTLHLTVNQCSSTSITACDSYTWRGSTYTATGIYTDNADTLHLTINYSTIGDTTATSCDSFIWHGTTYTESTQNPTFTIQNSNGCDSTITLSLTIYNSTSATDNVTSCLPFQWIDGNTYTASTDSPVFTLQSVHGCDSVVTLHFELLPASYTDIVDSFCTGTSYQFGALTLTEGGLYTDTLTASNSCDSIVTLNLTKLPLPYINIVQTDDCQTQTHHIHVETDVDYLYWTCDAQSWNNGWGSVHSHNLTVNSPFPVTFTLMADYYEYPTCPNTAIATLQPIVQPRAVMTVSPEFITHETPTLVALSQSTGAKSLQWYIDGDDAGNSHSITYTPPSGYDSIVVTLIAFNDLCSDTTEKTIPIKQQTLYLPNAFTPNESTNNTFSVFYDGIIEYELYIYSRQGTLLFHSNTNGEAWDGRYNGIPCPEGSYVWLVKYRSEVDPQNWHFAKGTVTLIY